jgi:hypothetical protein
VSERIAGKICSAPEEAGVTPPTEDELVRARKTFDEFQAKLTQWLGRSSNRRVAQVLGRHFRHRI